MKNLKLNLLSDSEMEEREQEAVKGGTEIPVDDWICDCNFDPGFQKSRRYLRTE